MPGVPPIVEAEHAAAKMSRWGSTRNICLKGGQVAHNPEPRGRRDQIPLGDDSMSPRRIDFGLEPPCLFVPVSPAPKRATAAHILRPLPARAFESKRPARNESSVRSDDTVPQPHVRSNNSVLPEIRPDPFQALVDWGEGDEKITPCAAKVRFILLQDHTPVTMELTDRIEWLKQHCSGPVNPHIDGVPVYTACNRCATTGMLGNKCVCGGYFLG